MLKVYLRQTIELLKQNKFISIISILGTALAIMMVMVFVVVDRIENADIAPESSRSELLYIRQAKYATKEGESTISNLLNHREVTLLREGIRSADKFSVRISTSSRIESAHTATTLPQGKKLRVELKAMGCDDVYWQLFDFKFIEGRPFSESDFKSGLKRVVITESVAKNYYGHSNVVGEKMELDGRDFTIVGVVKDVSRAFRNVHSDIWYPYTAEANYQTTLYYLVTLKAHPDNREAIESEIRRAEQNYNLTDDKFELRFSGPHSHRESHSMFLWAGDRERRQSRLRIATMFTLFMIIPAINLSGLSLSRMRRRTEEIGVRKAFGAKKRTLLVQVLYENFITSLIGGFIGALLSIVAVLSLQGWLLGTTGSAALPLSAFFSWGLLLVVVLASFVLNLLSSGIPAYRAANTEIVESLNRNN